MIYLVCNIGYKCMPTQGVKLGHINSLLSEIQMLESVCLQPLQQTNIRVSGPKKVKRESNLKRCINFSIFIKTNLFWRMLHGNGRSLNISAWNCRRGLLDKNNEATEKLLEIEQYIEEHKLHALCVIESDLHGATSRVRRNNPATSEIINASLGIEGYSIHLPDTWESHGQARIMLYIKDDLKCEIKRNPRDCNDLPSISCKIGIRNEKVSINFFYREWTSMVSGLNDIGSQKERLKRQISLWDNLSQHNENTMILGDANVCAMSWNDENFGQKDISSMIQDYLLRSSSHQMISQATHLNGSCIDHLYTNCPEKICEIKVTSVGNSDHMGICVRKLSKFPSSRPKTLKKRSYKNFDNGDFLTEVYDSNIEAEVTKHDTIDDAAEAFEKEFKTILNKHAPTRTIMIKKKCAQYISEETKMKINERRSLQTRIMFSNDPEEKRKFNKINKEVKNSIKHEKKKYFEENLSNETDPSKMWKTIKNLLGTTKNLSPEMIIKPNEDGIPETVTNPGKLSEIFNRFFKNKITKLRGKARSIPKEDPILRVRRWLRKRSEPPPPFSLKEVDHAALRRAIKRMKGGKVSGIDDIDSFSIKLAAPLMEDTLLHLVNTSIRTGRFAKNWKPQVISPLFKSKGQKTEISNYRPVSNLVETGKLAEYVVAEQIINHFINNDLFHENHHGSLPNHSTATAIIQLTNTWMEAAEKRMLSGVCLLDQSAAYDLLDHSIFPKKLKEYNFSNDSIEWIESYLQGRSQCVKIESTTSRLLECEESGAAQGSVLAGLFHLINSNDLPDCHEEGESVVYVDDDSDTVHANNQEELTEKLVKETQNTVEWLKDNKMVVAGGKSKILVVGTDQLRRTRLTAKISINIDGTMIEESRSERLLGALVNNKMTWHEHLYGDDENEGLLSQLKKRVSCLKRLSKYMKKDALKNVSNGIFYSKLSYCLAVYGNVKGFNDTYRETNKMYGLNSQDINRLQVLQNCVNRIITGARYGVSTEDLLKETDSLSIMQLMALHTVMLVRKITNTGKPKYLAQRLMLDEGNRNARRAWSGQMIALPPYKLETSKSGFIYRGASLFNSLPFNVRNEKRLKPFKTGAKTWIANNIKIKP